MYLQIKLPVKTKHLTQFIIFTTGEKGKIEMIIHTKENFCLAVGGDLNHTRAVDDFLLRLSITANEFLFAETAVLIFGETASW